MCSWPLFLSCHSCCLGLVSPVMCAVCPSLQEVCRLYRASLKLLDSWAIDRTVFNDEATKIRASVCVCVCYCVCVCMGAGACVWCVGGGSCVCDFHLELHMSRRVAIWYHVSQTLKPGHASSSRMSSCGFPFKSFRRFPHHRYKKKEKTGEPW